MGEYVFLRWAPVKVVKKKRMLLGPRFIRTRCSTPLLPPSLVFSPRFLPGRHLRGSLYISFIGFFLLPIVLAKNFGAGQVSGLLIVMNLDLKIFQVGPGKFRNLMAPFLEGSLGRCGVLH